jgi:AAA domain
VHAERWDPDDDGETGEPNPFHAVVSLPDAGRGDLAVTLAEFVDRRPDVDVLPLVECAQGALLPAAGLCLLGGKASAGKTTFVVDLLLHAAAGVDYCGLTFPRPLRTLVIENEGPREGFRVKLEARLQHGPHGGEPVRIWDDPPSWGNVRASDEELRRELRSAIEHHRIDLVVSDSLTRFGMVGNGTPEETRDFMTVLADIGLGRHVAILLLAHTRTRSDNAEDEIEQLAGAWAPHADAILMLRKHDGNRARLSYPKTRWTRGTVPASIQAFDPDTETFTLVATDEDQPDKVTADTYDQRVLQWVADHPWATTDDLDNEVEGRATEVRKARRRLQDAGHLYAAPSRQVGHPGKGMRWNLNNQAAQNPVPGLGTPQDENTPQPSQEGNPVRPVPPLRRDEGAGRGSRTAQPDTDWVIG